MARDEAPPFEKGTTFYQGGTIDSSNLGGVNFEGKEFEFEDTQFNTGMRIRMRVVRNSGALTLQAKRLVTFDKTTPAFGLRVNGYATVDADYCLPVDDQLGANGCPPNDLCWVVIRGPALVKTSLNGDATNVINVGDSLVSQTAATSGATTAGHIYTAALTGATSVLANQLNNRVGRATSAATTANTNSDLLAFIGSGCGW